MARKPDHKRWSVEAQALARLLCTPEGMEMTQDELAKEVGYSLRSVNRLMNDPDFSEYVAEVAADFGLASLMPEVLVALRKSLRGAQPSMKAAELVLKARGLLKEIRQVDSTVTIDDKTQGDDVLDEIAKLRKEIGLDDGTGEAAN